MRNNSVVIGRTHGLIHLPHLTMKIKTASNETKMPNANVSSLTMLWRYHQGQQTQSEHLPTNLENGTQQVVWHHWRSLRKLQVCWFPSEQEQNNWQKNSTQSNQCKGITKGNQKESTNCKVLCSHSQAIQVYQTSRYCNPHYDTERWSRSDHLPKSTPQNETTRAAKQHFLVPDNWKAWKILWPHPNTDMNPQRNNWA